MCAERRSRAPQHAHTGVEPLNPRFPACSGTPSLPHTNSATDRRDAYERAADTAHRRADRLRPGPARTRPRRSRRTRQRRTRMALPLLRTRDRKSHPRPPPPRRHRRTHRGRPQTRPTRPVNPILRNPQKSRRIRIHLPRIPCHRHRRRHWRRNPVSIGRDDRARSRRPRRRLVRPALGHRHLPCGRRRVRHRCARLLCALETRRETRRSSRNGHRRAGMVDLHRLENQPWAHTPGRDSLFSQGRLLSGSSRPRLDRCRADAASTRCHACLRPRPAFSFRGRRGRESP